ncbi:MAG: hypothetical protein JNM52_10980 [Betaproteobacteria bacterium]|nr:hypothetical protein [Betaproteobacteria bacterium]
MSTLYSSRLVPTTASATTAASGYPATNVLLQSLGAPWRATGTGQTDVIIDLGAAKTVRGVAVSDVNFTGCTIASSADNTTYTDRATPTYSADRFGRIRGIAALNTSARYWRIRIASGTPADSLGYWRIGAVYLFGATASIASPQYGFSIDTEHAEARDKLLNGREAVAAVGNRFDRITGSFKVASVSPGSSFAIGSLLQAMRAGVVWLDMGVSVRPWWTWPLIHNAATDREAMPNYDISDIKLDAREVV